MFVTVGRWDTLLESPPQGALPQVTRSPLSVSAANAYSLLKMSTMPDASSEATLLESPPVSVSVAHRPGHDLALVSFLIAAKLPRPAQKALSILPSISFGPPGDDQMTMTPSPFTATNVAESVL